MNISYKAPTDRGVTQLMYVGDDEAVDKAVGDARDSHLLFGSIAAIVAMQSKGITRLAALALAGYVVYRATQARK
jgi:hypothetical protein